MDHYVPDEDDIKMVQDRMESYAIGKSVNLSVQDLEQVRRFQTSTATQKKAKLDPQVANFRGVMPCD
jgi:hypothetical protein